MNTSFDKAFDYVMKWEVGVFWNPNNSETIKGSILNASQKRNVGYTNIAQDAGGETKFGISKRAYPNIDIAKLDLVTAKSLYYKDYWLAAHCDNLSAAVALIHFDGAVNHGVGRAIKFLEQAVGLQPDGKFDTILLGKVSAFDPIVVINNIAKARTEFYKNIVVAKPNQKMFLNGWLARITDVQRVSISQI